MRMGKTMKMKMGNPGGEAETLASTPPLGNTFRKLTKKRPGMGGRSRPAIPFDMSECLDYSNSDEILTGSFLQERTD